MEKECLFLTLQKNRRVCSVNTNTLADGSSIITHLSYLQRLSKSHSRVSIKPCLPSISIHCSCPVASFPYSQANFYVKLPVTSRCRRWAWSIATHGRRPNVGKRELISRDLLHLRLRSQKLSLMYAVKEFRKSFARSGCCMESQYKISWLVVLCLSSGSWPKMASCRCGREHLVLIVLLASLAACTTSRRRLSGFTNVGGVHARCGCNRTTFAPSSSMAWT